MKKLKNRFRQICFFKFLLMMGSLRCYWVKIEHAILTRKMGISEHFELHWLYRHIWSHWLATPSPLHWADVRYVYIGENFPPEWYLSSFGAMQNLLLIQNQFFPLLISHLGLTWSIYMLHPECDRGEEGVRGEGGELEEEE